MPEKELVIKNNDLDDDIKAYDLNDLEETNNSAEKVLSNEDFNDLKYKIIDMNKENFIQLIDNIKSIQDETKKQELYDLFIKTIKNGIIESDTYENDKELIDEIDNFVVALIDFDPVTERLFITNEFNFENIKKQKDSKLEIKKIENSINELENKYLYTREYILKNLLNEKEELENNIKLQKNNTNSDDIATDILLTSLEQVNNDLEIQNKFGNNLTIDEKDILVEDKEYQEQQLEIAKKVIDYEYEQAEIDLAISKENLRILNKQLNVLKNGQNNHEFQSKDLNDKDLKPISEFLDIIIKKNKELPNDKFFIKEDDINYYILERDSSIKLDEKIQELEKLKEQEESKQKELKKNLEDKVIAKKELVKLTNNKIYKETYYNILNNVKRNFKKFDSNTSVTNFINNHESLKKLSNYKYFNKLKEELIDESVKQVNLKRIKKVEENKKLWLKALTGVTGFATGLVVSCVPGVGTIQMGLAAAKVTTSAINFYTKKHPNGKISKFKINLTDKLEIKHPKLTENINNMKKKLNSYPLNSFVNGLSLGYLTGNVIEMVSGDNLFNHLEKYLSSDYEDVLVNNPINIPTPETKPHIELNVPKEEIVVPKPVTPTPEVPDVIIPEQVIEQFIPKPGEVFDLSSLTKGYKSPDATSLIDVMESLGKEVVFDKAKVLPDGKVMWHFKQLTGEGYAWFDSEVIQQLMSQTTNVLSKKL